MKTHLCRGCLRLVEACRCKPESRESKPGNRESAAKRGYGRKWRKFREDLWIEVVRSGVYPTCAICKKSFQNDTPHFDHIEPVESADDPKFFEKSNIQFLHHECHALKTSRDIRNGKTRKTKRTT